jgi:N-acetylneuraminic acid mutarotase
MIVWGGGSEHQFHNDGGVYDPDKDQWRPVSQTGAPSGRWGHAAVWTGTEMIVWGGRSNFAPADNKNDGARYNPETDTWQPMSTEGAPTPRSQMAAVWTGQEMIVWGGWGDGGVCPASGGSYDPRTDRWTVLPVENAPDGRLEPAFVWTGRELIVWGGLLEGGMRSAGTGGRYDPERRIWKALPTAGTPASARGVEAIWTGNEMVVWGGSHLDGDSPINIGLNTGARYNPTTDSWQPTPVNGAPEGRMYYAAVWTGSEMIVWSGGDQRRGNDGTGGRYNPATGHWIATANAGAPSGRGLMSAVWTGEGMLIYGGSTGGVEAFSETYYYLPEGKTTLDPDIP